MSMEADDQIERVYLKQLHEYFNAKLQSDLEELLYWSINYRLPSCWLIRFTSEGTMCVVKDGQGCRVPIR
jgi:hypothetical protein